MGWAGVRGVAAGVVRPVPHSRLPAGFAAAFAEIPISTVGIPCGMAAAYGRPVAIREGNVLAVSFHPELTGETRLHRMLLDLSD